MTTAAATAIDGPFGTASPKMELSPMKSQRSDEACEACHSTFWYPPAK